MQPSDVRGPGTDSANSVGLTKLVLQLALAPCCCRATLLRLASAAQANKPLMNGSWAQALQVGKASFPPAAAALSPPGASGAGAAAQPTQ